MSSATSRSRWANWSRTAPAGVRGLIIVLNPAVPPVIMRDTVLALVHDPDGLHQTAIRDSVARMVADVAAYVPGYRLKQEVQFIEVPAEEPVHTLAGEDPVSHQVTVLLEVEGAAHYLPAYAGNLDIMTSAALRVAERMAEHALQELSA